MAYGAERVTGPAMTHLRGMERLHSDTMRSYQCNNGSTEVFDLEWVDCRYMLQINLGFYIITDLL